MTISVLTVVNAAHDLVSKVVSINLFDSEGNITEFYDEENPVEITIPLQVMIFRYRLPNSRLVVLYVCYMLGLKNINHLNYIGYKLHEEDTIQADQNPRARLSKIKVCGGVLLSPTKGVGLETS